jgi:hypothetical protein
MKAFFADIKEKAICQVAVRTPVGNAVPAD